MGGQAITNLFSQTLRQAARSRSEDERSEESEEEASPGGLVGWLVPYLQLGTTLICLAIDEK